VETPRRRGSFDHDWFVAIVTFIAAVASSAILYAYGQGQQEHRIQTLEKQIADIRADWKEARTRIERELRDREPPPRRTP
jgi:membrane protein DedA with SNARE-associated domain